MNWIQHPLRLEGERIILEPLQQNHLPLLTAIAKNKTIWEHLPLDGADEQTLIGNLKQAILKRSYGEQYPFVVVEKNTGNICGSTRLFELFPEHKKLEIGWTWYAPQYWGNGYNLECKLLLLTYCFETLGVQRVQLKTRTTNLRSRAAIVKLGAKQEGILRKDRIMPGSLVRDTVVFSIIDDEWPEAKTRLRRLMEERYGGQSD